MNTDTDGSPFHEGERQVQDRAGTRARMEVAGPRLIRDHMPDQHRELFEKLPFVIAALADATGQPWATLVAGAPGFITTSPRHMQLSALPDPADPVRAALTPGAPIGLLGIELSTRRRNRMNGKVGDTGPMGFSIDVVQSFGNCPKYIQTRQHEQVVGLDPVSRLTESAGLSVQARKLIAEADTFFIATTSGLSQADWTGGIDVSHRGGEPGFVQMQDGPGGIRLRVPDFSGNGFFNTLGNLALDARTGLLFVDFAHGHLLQLAARGSVTWNDAETAAASGADRVLELDVTGGQWLHNAVDLRWS